MRESAYAWCFSHGDMHNFADTRPWCTADWVDLGTRNAVSAERIKHDHFGDARFMHQLPLEAQEAVMEQVREREEAAR